LNRSPPRRHRRRAARWPWRPRARASAPVIRTLTPCPFSVVVSHVLDGSPALDVLTPSEGSHRFRHRSTPGECPGGRCAAVSSDHVDEHPAHRHGAPEPGRPGLIQADLLDGAVGGRPSAAVEGDEVRSGLVRRGHRLASGSSGSNGKASVQRPNVMQNQPYSTAARCLTRPSRFVPDGVIGRCSCSSSRPCSVRQYRPVTSRRRTPGRMDSASRRWPTPIGTFLVPRHRRTSATTRRDLRATGCAQGHHTRCRSDSSTTGRAAGCACAASTCRPGGTGHTPRRRQRAHPKTHPLAR